MNEIQTIKLDKINEVYYKINHKSGLTIYVLPKSDYIKTYALFATKFGSVNNHFINKTENKEVKIPDGIAHFLEHKMFEGKDEDAFARYARTGASANAYTSFDKTAYLFSCTDMVYESLEILLDFVTSPYFTPETVEKEQGIIGQEIRMYDDDPSWRVLVNLLGALYHNHPVKIDIAGTVESIAQITDKTLYDCYNAYYNLNNMALCISGNVNAEKVLEVADKVLKTAPKLEIENVFEDEPDGIVRDYVEQKLEVSTPIFYVGFKDTDVNTDSGEYVKKMCEVEILMQLIAGRSGDLYTRLYSEGVINNNFESEFLSGDSYGVVLFGASESENPEYVRDEILAEIDKLKNEGIKKEDFERARNLCYAKTVSCFNNVGDISSMLLSAAFIGCSLKDITDSYSEVTVDAVEKRLNKLLRKEHCALSVVKNK